MSIAGKCLTIFLTALRYTNIAMENGAFEDVFPLHKTNIFHCNVCLQEGINIMNCHFFYHQLLLVSSSNQTSTKKRRV